MAKSPKDNNDWASLPVLTEIVGDVAPEIPVLMEEAFGEQKLARDSDGQALSVEEIAALLAPRLEKQLRAKLSAQFETLWQESWRQARASLPQLIRDQLAAQPGSIGLAGNAGLGGSKIPALDIIAPQSAAGVTKKPSAARTATAKAKTK